MSAFDEALPQTLRIVEASTLAPLLSAATIVRDLQGRVRLILELRTPVPANWDAECQRLSQNLAVALGVYWGGQIWREGPRDDAAVRALREAIQRHRRRWHDAPTTAAHTLTWYRLERQFSKSAWLLGGPVPPWNLDDADAPAIVSFYSFKGGVGRTLAVATTAILLARAGKRVATIDLDLEAPGLGSLLLGDVAPPEDGIVDYLIERQVHGVRPTDLSPYTAVQINPDLVGSEPIRVLTAGRLDINFLEKMARLDFEGFVGTGPNPLNDLLVHTREEYHPDFILLDVRSGLHDLGGLSVNGLSHLDVLFCRENPQSWAGLATVLRLLGTATPRRNVLVVHALVPPPNVDPQAHERFLPLSYNLFREHYFTPDEDVPDITDPEAPYGFHLPFLERLQAMRDLVSVADLLTDPRSGYFDLARLIGTYLERDTL